MREVKLLALNIIQEITTGNDIKIIKRNVEKILKLCTKYNIPTSDDGFDFDSNDEDGNFFD